MVRQPVYDNFPEILFSGHEYILMDHLSPLCGFLFSTSRMFFSGYITEKGNFSHSGDKNEISDCHIVAFHVLSVDFHSLRPEILADILGKDFVPCLAQWSSLKSMTRKNHLKREIDQFYRVLVKKWQLAKNEKLSGNPADQLSDSGQGYFIKTECNLPHRPENPNKRCKTESWLCRNVTRLIFEAGRMFNRIIKPENSMPDNLRHEFFSFGQITEYPSGTASRNPVRIYPEPTIQQPGKKRIISHLTYFIRAGNHACRVTEIKKQIRSG